MDIQKIVKLLLKETASIDEAEKLLVNIFVAQHPVLMGRIDKICSYWNDSDDIWVKSIATKMSENILLLSFDNMIECFEMMVSDEERKKKGVVYTPDEIKDYIIRNVVNREDVPKVIDPSCGCGAFLITTAIFLHKKYGKSYREIIEEYIFGIDIDENAIRRTKILLTILACLSGEEVKKFNLFIGNALDIEFVNSIKEEYGGFDCVVGNPPYVRYRNLTNEQKKHYKNWKSTSSGNVDLYMPFFEVGLYLLAVHGTLGYITPNSFLQAVNARKLREYFLTESFPIEIIDFRDSQVFKNATSYTCITIINKALPDSIIKYVRIEKNALLQEHDFAVYNKNYFQDDEPWRMYSLELGRIIKLLENTGIPLSKWKIRNGLATLSNNLYFFIPFKEDEQYFYREYKGNVYKIERNICINIAKPNVIKSEQDLIANREVAIFPYVSNDGVFEVIPENEFSIRYPNTYKFFLEYRDDLGNRDKGKGVYSTWYAYGRTQGMNNFGKKLLLPYMSDKPTAVLSVDERLLFYCGYAVFSEDEDELKIIKCFLESDAFWYYIFHTSKPYSKGYMSFAKNYLVKFSIPSLTDEEKKELLSFDTDEQRNKFIWGMYGINEKCLP